MSARNDQAQLESALDRLTASHLPSAGWFEVDRAVAAATAALDHNDDDGLAKAVVALSNAAFRSDVSARLGTGHHAAPAVAPTKRSPALPIVGFVCGLVILGLGWSLGGGVVLLGTAVMALFILGVAVTGMSSFSVRRTPTRDVAVADDRHPMPERTADAVGQLRASLP